MASDNPKKFWKRKTDGKLILNPLNNQHLIMCTTNPCGDYWAIFGLKTHYVHKKDGVIYGEDNFSYKLKMCFIIDGKAVWQQEEWDQDQGDYILKDHCASIDINGRPNGRQKLITIYKYEEQDTPEDQIYDEENEEWIYIPATYKTTVYEDEKVTEWYRISPCFQTKQQALQAFYYPCNVQPPYSDVETSSQWQNCLKSYWMQKVVKVSSPLYSWRREYMNTTYAVIMEESKDTMRDVSYTFQYNPNNGQICDSISSDCVTGTLNSVEFDSSYLPYTRCSIAYMLTNGHGYYDYRTEGETTFTDEVSLSCTARKNALQALNDILAPHIYNELQKKQTYLNSYYYGYRNIQNNNYEYSVTSYSPYVSYSSGGITKQSFNYEGNTVYQSMNYGRVYSGWGRFIYKKTNQTPTESTGIKVEITINQKKITKTGNASTTEEKTTSFEQILQYNKYYEKLPFPTYLTVFKLLKNLKCTTYYDYDDEGQIIYTYDDCQGDDCNFQFEPGYQQYGGVNDKSHKFVITVKPIDVVFPQQFIKKGYPMIGEKDYGN